MRKYPEKTLCQLIIDTCVQGSEDGSDNPQRKKLAELQKANLACPSYVPSDAKLKAKMKYRNTNALNVGDRPSETYHAHYA